MRNGVTAEIVTAHDTSISTPAMAASALSLAESIYSPSFDVQKMLTRKSENARVAEKIVLVL